MSGGTADLVGLFSEMDYGMEFLVEVSGQKLESSQTQVFVLFSILIFPFYKMLLTLIPPSESVYGSHFFAAKLRQVLKN